MWGDDRQRQSTEVRGPGSAYTARLAADIASVRLAYNSIAITHPQVLAQRTVWRYRVDAVLAALPRDILKIHTLTGPF